jgi:hypothetical protein
MFNYEGRKNFTKYQYQVEVCPLLGHYEMFSCNSLPAFWDKQSVPSSRNNKSNMKNYLKTETNSVLRVRQLQTGHAPLTRELCGENLITLGNKILARERFVVFLT